MPVVWREMKDQLQGKLCFKCQSDEPIDNQNYDSEELTNQNRDEV